MAGAQEEQLPLGVRATAAAGAAVVAAAIVNPLDVIKTRIQAQAMAGQQGQQVCPQPHGGQPYCSTLYEHTARRVLQPCSTEQHQRHQPQQQQQRHCCAPRHSQQHLLRHSHTLSPQAAAWASSMLPRSAASSGGGSSLAAATLALTSAAAAADSAAAGVAAAAAARFRRWGITEGPIPVRRTPYGLAGSPAAALQAAASAASGAASGSAARGGGSAALLQATAALAPAAAGSCACSVAAAGPAVVAMAAPAPAAASMQLPAHSMWETARVISSREGLPVLWRGTWASLLIAVPMVGIYMPLYDSLVARWSSELGGAAPVAAGTAARTAACFCVAPFELLRTRLQAAEGARVSTRSMLHAFLHDTPHGQLQQQHQVPRQAAAAAAAGAVVQAPAAGASAAKPAVVVLRAVPRMWTGFSATLVRDVPFSALYWALVEPLRRAMLPRNSHWRPFQQQRQRAQPQHRQQQQQVHHTQQEILVANMVSGFVAGGVAAGATTPFDVVKTRMQIAQPGSSSSSSSSGPSSGTKVWRVLRQVHAQQGLEGLFAGVKPRAARAAPACGIVISVYELLKDLLAPPDALAGQGLGA